MLDGKDEMLCRYGAHVDDSLNWEIGSGKRTLGTERSFQDLLFPHLCMNATLPRVNSILLDTCLTYFAVRHPFNRGGLV